MAFGQVKYDITQPQLTITLDDPNPVALPPAGNEFGTLLAHSGGGVFDDNGGQVGVIRYLGDAPALVQIDCTMSFERLPGSWSQHLFIGFSVGQPPTLATVSPDTRQETDLAFDEQDTILNIQSAFVLQPNDVVQVWIRRTDPSPDDDLLMKVTGFMLTATTADGSDMVGDLKVSLLTESQFQATHGTDWVLADGQSAAGTAYEALTGNAVVPDMRGRAMRMLDPTGTVDPDGAGRVLGDQQGDEFQAHQHQYADTGTPFTGTAGAAAGFADTDQTIRTTGFTGGSETRMKNVAVNVFVKVN